MANRKQKHLAKHKLASCNGGASTTIKEIQHGSWAFQNPDQAISRKKARHSKTWKISKKHPANPVVKNGKV